MYKRLYNFLKCYNILNAEQFGFRPGHATSHATTLVISNIADAFEKKLNNWCFLGSLQSL